MRILIVEDEVRLARNIAAFLRKPGGYAVDVSGDGEDGRHMALTNSYDLIILDLMLPKVNGWTILKDLRAQGVRTPVLVLTARDTTEDLVRGLNEGGDDYLTKPFELAELAARCNALIRRSHGRADATIRVGAIEIDTLSHHVKSDGCPVALHAMEYRLLEYLALRCGQVVSKEDIMERLYDKRLTQAWRVVATVEGESDEVSLIGEVQWRIFPRATVKINSGFGLTKAAPDIAPELGVMISF